MVKTEHSSKKFELEKGWNGNGERFKEEMYIRHEINSQHIKRMESFQKIDVLFSNNIISEVKRWANKFPSQQNAELRSKFNTKMAEGPVGNTSRNREGPNILNAVEAERIVIEHTGTLLEQSFLEQQDDGFTDNGRKVPRRRCQ